MKSPREIRNTVNAARLAFLTRPVRPGRGNTRSVPHTLLRAIAGSCRLYQAGRNSSFIGPVNRGRLMPLALLLANLAFASPILFFRYPPMTDLASHEAVVAILRHFDNPLWAIPGVYESHWGFPNQLFYLLAWPISFVVGTTWACKLVVFASAFGMLPACLLLTRTLNAPRSLAFAFSSLAYGYAFYWGLAPNLLATTLFVAVLPSLLRHAESPTATSAIRAASALLLLYFAHESVMLAAGLCFLISVLTSPSDRTRRGLKVLPGVLALGAVCLEQVVVRHHRSSSLQASRIVFAPLQHRLLEFPSSLFGDHGPVPERLMFVLLVAGIATSCLGERAESPYRRSLVLSGVALLFAYLTTPTVLLGARLFHQRFAVLGILTLGAGLASGITIRWRIADVLGPSCCAASLLLAIPSFVASHQEVTAIDAVAEVIAPGASMIAFHAGEPTADEPAGWNGICGHLLALRGGRCWYDVTSSPISPVTRRKEHAWDEPLARIQKNEGNFYPNSDFRIFRYALFYVTNPRVAETLQQVLSRNAVLRAQAGHWQVFESTRDVLPITSTDAELPIAEGPSLVSEVRARLDSGRRSAPSTTP